MAKIEMEGLRFGMLTVIRECPERDSSSSVRWLCRCDCGREKAIVGCQLRKGKVFSCGCVTRRAVKRVETNQTPEEIEIRDHLYSRYKAFSAKKQPICREWKVFPNFYKWAIESGYVIGAKLCRYDENEPYSPDNCNWQIMKNNDNARMYDKAVRETMNRWNRTVNVFRKACGLKLFPVVEEPEGVDADG